MSIISILSSLNPTSDDITSGNISLKQGASFRGMQNQIVSSVMPQLPLISKSSGNNIFSVVEGFENPSKALEDEIKKEEKDLANAKSRITKMTDKENSVIKKVVGAIEEKNNTELLNAINSYKTINSDFESQQSKFNYYDTKSGALYPVIGNNVDNLKGTIPQVESQQQEIKRLRTAGHTLRGELEDNTLQMNAQYLRYFIWFVSAVTLGLVAVKKASN